MIKKMEPLLKCKFLENSANKKRCEKGYFGKITTFVDKFNS